MRPKGGPQPRVYGLSNIQAGTSSSSYLRNTSMCGFEQGAGIEYPRFR